MIEMKVDISKVDYGEVMERVLPDILPKIAKDQNGVMQKVLLGISSQSGEIAKNALQFLPQSLQDEIAVSLLNSYKAKMIDALHKFAVEQHIAIDISDFNVELKK